MDLGNVDIINKETSIEKMRLTLHRSKTDKVWLLVKYTLIIVGLVIVPLILSIKLIMENHSILSIIITSIILTLGISILFSIKNNNKLVKIEGGSIITNNRNIQEVANCLKWELEYNSESYTILSRPMSWRYNYWGREMVIINHNNDIYINCITLTLESELGNSPIHWFGNRKEEKNFVKEFEKHLAL